MFTKLFLTHIFLITIAFVIGVACTPGNHTAKPGSSTSGVASLDEQTLDYAGLQDSLQAAGLSLEYPRTEPPDLFAVSANIISVNHALITVYEFDDPAAAKAAAASVSPDGIQVSGQKVDRHGTIHFFQRDRLIVLYAGDFPLLYDALTVTLGSQIAGGDPPPPFPTMYERVPLPPPLGSDMASAPPPAWLIFGDQVIPGTFVGYTTPLLAVEAEIPASLTAVSLSSTTQAVIVMGDVTISSFEIAVAPWLTSPDQISSFTTQLLAVNVQPAVNLTVFSLLPFEETGDYLLHANLAYAGGSAEYVWHLNLKNESETSLESFLTQMHQGNNGEAALNYRKIT
jgi:hypothetical protein